MQRVSYKARPVQFAVRRETDEMPSYKKFEDAVRGDKTRCYFAVDAAVKRCMHLTQRDVPEFRTDTAILRSYFQRVDRIQQRAVAHWQVCAIAFAN